MRYYRLTKGKVDVGQILTEEEIENVVDGEGAYYKSLYYYPEEALTYFKEKGRFKGYKGKAYSDYLVFDIDSEDLEGSRKAVIKLIDYLQPRGLYEEMASVISYSGSKGYHLRIRVSEPLEPFQLKKLCTYLAKEAEVKIDPVIYNITRPFRLVNTQHEKTGLYKVDIPETDVRNYTDLEIREFAKTLQPVFDTPMQIESQLIEKILEGINALKVPRKHRIRRPKRPVSDIKEYPCYSRIRSGDIPAGESNTALLRLTQFYKDAGFSRDEAHRELVEVAELRAKVHPEANPIDETKITYEILSSIYDGDGYTYSHHDEYLQSICSGSCKLHDKLKIKPEPIVFNTKREIPLRSEGFGAKIAFGKPKGDEMTAEDKLKKFGFESFKETSKNFAVFAKEVHARAVETGIPELDQYIKIIPNGLTLINARPSVGKSSLVLNMLKNTSLRGLKTLFYCADMEKDEFMAKVKSSVLGISPDDVYHLYENPDMADLIGEAEEQVDLMLSNVMPCYDTSISVDKIEQHLKLFKEQGELPSAIFIDYIQKMDGCHDYGKGVDTLLGLKTLIAKYKVPIIALSQIPRMGGNEETPVLTSGAAKGGSIYEESASIVMNMWRPMKFSPDSSWDNVIVIKIAKNRMGETPPEIALHFNGKISEIRGMTEDEYEQYEIRKAEYEELKKAQKKGVFR